MEDQLLANLKHDDCKNIVKNRDILYKLNFFFLSYQKFHIVFISSVTPSLPTFWPILFSKQINDPLPA